MFIIITVTLSGCATTPERGIAPVERARPTPFDRSSRGGIHGFSWPIKGTVISYFGQMTNDCRNNGVDIAAPRGSVVSAAQSGKVVFSNEMVRGFGKTVIIDHHNGFQTVYAFNSAILVEPGADVRANDPIARTGATGRVENPALHFEIRKDGRPLNPLFYLQHS